VLGLVLTLSAAWCNPLHAQTAAPPEPKPAAIGSYDVAPVRILGIPAISVAAPVVSRQSTEPDAQQRAAVIEGNLSLLHQPHSSCDPGEAIAETILEGLVLGGPAEQRVCSGDPWAVLGQPNDLAVVVNSNGADQLQLQAELKGRPKPLPLLSVTEADAQLHGLSRQQLAQRWRQVLQRRLRHARFTEQASQISLRLKTTLLLELLLAATAAGTFTLWSWLRRRLRHRLDHAQNNQDLQGLRVQLLQGLLRGLFLAVLVQLVLMAGLAVAAMPGQIPLAISVLLQPLGILFKVLLLGLCAAGLRVLALFVLRQWVSNLAVPIAERARRKQRYQNLLQASQRLINLGCVAVLVMLVLIDIPGFRQLTLGAWVAGGALLGGLAIAFQGLLRDGVAGLVALLDDHYAVGDVVEVNGITGEVIDVGILVTELRTADQRVVQFANSCAQPLVNHTKIRSGVEVLIPLAPQQHQLEQALALVAAECQAFAADPAWSEQLLAAPWVRGVKQVTPLAIELSVVLTTRTGQQWAAERALLQRLVVRLQAAQIQLAGGAVMPPGN
jgi:small conductance mechanosensitive channel